MKSFCEHDILIPDFSASYIARQGCLCHKIDHNTIKHHFRVEIYIYLDTIDKQLQELNSKVNDQVMDLLSLSSTLIPKDDFKNLDLASICTKYYPMNFTK